MPVTALTPHASSSPVSRATVSTNIDENQPMLIRPSHFQPSVISFDVERNPIKGNGMATAETTNIIGNRGQAGINIIRAGNSLMPM